MPKKGAFYTGTGTRKLHLHVWDGRSFVICGPPHWKGAKLRGASMRLSKNHKAYAGIDREKEFTLYVELDEE